MLSLQHFQIKRAKRIWVKMSGLDHRYSSIPLDDWQTRESGSDKTRDQTVSSVA